MPKKSILIIDLDGALLYHRPFKNAHEKWFELFSILLKDKSLNYHANKDDYYQYVNEIMQKYLKNAGKENQDMFARTIYAMITVSELKKTDLVIEFKKFLKKIKQKYALALVTSTPEIGVKAILEKIKCKDLFDIVIGSPIDQQPSKKVLLKEFKRQYGQPLFYIGNGDKDIESARQLKIKTISVNWVSKGKYKGDYDIDTVKELDKII